MNSSFDYVFWAISNIFTDFYYTAESRGLKPYKLQVVQKLTAREKEA
jgi:hypothetical protein